MCPAFPSLLQFAVALGEDPLLTACQFVGRGDVADRAVEPLLVVVADILRDDPLSLAPIRERLEPDGLRLQAVVPALQLAVALRVERARAHVRHARQADELLEVLGHELRPVVGDDPGRGAGELLLRPLDEQLDVGFFHLFFELAVDDEAAVPVQNRAQVVERAARIDVAHVDVPVLVRRVRLVEPRAFFSRA